MPKRVKAHFNPASGQWEARITTSRGSAAKPGPRKTYTFDAPDQKTADAIVADIMRSARAGKLAELNTGETFAEWFEVWLAHRAKVGTKRAKGPVRTVADDRGRF